MHQSDNHQFIKILIAKGYNFEKLKNPPKGLNQTLLDELKELTVAGQLSLLSQSNVVFTPKISPDDKKIQLIWRDLSFWDFSHFVKKNLSQKDSDNFIKRIRLALKEKFITDADYITRFVRLYTLSEFFSEVEKLSLSEELMPIKHAIKQVIEGDSYDGGLSSDDDSDEGLYENTYRKLDPEFKKAEASGDPSNTDDSANGEKPPQDHEQSNEKNTQQSFKENLLNFLNEMSLEDGMIQSLKSLISHLSEKECQDVYKGLESAITYDEKIKVMDDLLKNAQKNPQGFFARSKKGFEDFYAYSKGTLLALADLLYKVMIEVKEFIMHPVQKSQAYSKAIQKLFKDLYQSTDECCKGQSCSGAG